MSHHNHPSHGRPNKGPVTGGSAQVPAGAPKEVSQPLNQAAVDLMLARARDNEQVLKDLPAPGSGPVVPPPAPAPAPDPEPVPVAVAVATVGDGPGEPPAGGAQASAGTELVDLAAEFSAPTPVAPAPDTQTGPRRPAESNTDSPSRGQPRPILDSGKRITGGWGEGGGGSQYYALDGLELQTIIRTLMDQMKTQMAQDLRLGIAVTYPEVRIRVQVLIDGAHPDAPVNEAKFSLEKDRILTLELETQDDSHTPADALRDEAGLVRPAKQTIQAGAMRILVDVPHVGAGQ